MVAEFNDTIVSIATPHGVGAISIIRLSGAQALELALKVTKLKKETLKPRYAHLKNLYNYHGKLIDKAIVIYFKAPNSFTGEDIVEFQIHGGIVVAQLVIKTVLDFGGRLAKPGEFSKRAFLNEKIDLTEAEAISKIIEAKSEEAVLTLSRQLNGELKKFVQKVRTNLIDILAHSEVAIDYAEDEIPPNIEEKILSRLNVIIEKVSKLLKNSKKRNRIFDGFRVAIVGRPNVGKSSILNLLLNYDRAIVSNVAGTTRDSVEDYINIGTHLVKIIDTAGIRETDNLVEKIGIEKTLEMIENADIVLAVFDRSDNLQDDDKKLIETLNKFKGIVIIILNKNDLPAKIETISELKSVNEFPFSVINCSDEILIEEMEKILTKINTSSEGGSILSSARQILAVEKTLISLKNAKPVLQSGELELFSFYINEAIGHISSISRQYTFNEMLDSMFSNFCLGK